MADKRESFASLEDATGEGAALTKSIEGDAKAGKVGSVGFAFVDSSNNLVLPKLIDGQIPVTSEQPGNCVDGNGTLAGTGTEADVAVATLTPSSKYKNIEAIGSCFRDTIFRVVQVDDATVTELGQFICGPGQYSFKFDIKCLEIVAGATGTQSLKLVAKNLNSTSDIRGTIAAMGLDE